jgi:hypothetical protein
MKKTTAAPKSIETLLRKGLLLPALVGLLMINTISAQAASWTFEWNAVTETPASKGFLLTGTNPNTATASGLEIPHSAFYSSPASGLGFFTGNSTTGWTVAFRARRVDTSALFGSFFTVFDGAFLTSLDWQGNTQYRQLASPSNAFATAPGSNNRVFQDFHITNLAGVVNLYLNGSDTPFRSSFTAQTATNPALIRFGDSSSGDPVSEISNVRWSNQGAFTPTAIPEPSSIMFLGLCALAAIILRRHQLRKGHR